MVQVCLVHQSEQKKSILKAIEDSLLVPPLLSQTGIILIFQGKFRTFPSIFHLSTNTAGGKLWGLPLSNCPNCKTNLYLEGSGSSKKLLGSVYCQGCTNKGTIHRPADWPLLWHFLDTQRDGFWMGTHPEPGSLSIDWLEAPTIMVYQKSPEKKIIKNRQILAVKFCFLQ